MSILSMRLIVAATSLALGFVSVVVLRRYPVSPKWIAELLLLSPSVCAFAGVVLGMDYVDLLKWVLTDAGQASVLLFVLAILPTVMGLISDAPIAYLIYRHRYRREPDGDYAKIAKFGHPHHVIERGGRFDVGIAHNVFAIGNNLLSALSSVFLIQFVSTMPELTGFISRHAEWISFMALLAFAALLMSLIHASMEQRGTKPTNTDFDGENPDMFLLSRFHMLTNLLYIVVIVTLDISLLGIVVVCHLATGVKTDLDPTFLGLMCSTIAFLWWTSVSPLAKRYDSKSRGLWPGGLIFGVMGALFIVLISCNISKTVVAAMAICVIAGILAVRAKSPRFDVMAMFPMFILVGFLCVAGVYFAV